MTHRPLERHLPLLRRHDRVAVITPSGPPEQDSLDRGCDLLRTWGLDVMFGRHVSTLEAMTAGSDTDRVGDIIWALTDPSIAAVFCGRGGYGLLRILDRIPWDDIQNAPMKPVIGFSDVTCLHAALELHLGWPSILGPHVAGGLGSTTPDALSIESLKRLLFEGRLQPLFTDATRVMRAGRVEALPLRGGNLAMLAAMAGSLEGASRKTPFIAVLEDVNEAPYRVDRMLTQLLRSGWFEGASGVVCGSWDGCRGQPTTEDPQSSDLSRTTSRVMKNAGVRISESDSFARSVCAGPASQPSGTTEDRTSHALNGSPRTPRAANMAGEAPALAFRHPARSTPVDQLEEVLMDRLDLVQGPIVFDAPFGHGALHFALPLGVDMTLDTSLRVLTFSATDGFAAGRS